MGTPKLFRYGSVEVEHLRSKDARLGAAIDRIGEIERPVDDDLFSSVIHHIIGQQISGKAQRTVWSRMCAAMGDVTPEAVARADVSALQSFGMTWRKAGHIKAFAEDVRSGAFDLAAVERMSDDEAIVALSSLRGIGTWTAEMILLFCLGRPDVLSFGDLGIRRGMRMVYRHWEIDRERFERYRRRLSPYGSVASLYFWAVAGGAIPELTDPAPKRRR